MTTWLAVKMLDGLCGALVAALRRGERDSEAMVMGDGDAISMSMGVPAAWLGAANMVCARAKGVRVFFLDLWAPPPRGSGGVVRELR